MKSRGAERGIHGRNDVALLFWKISEPFTVGHASGICHAVS